VALAKLQLREMYPESLSQLAFVNYKSFKMYLIHNMFVKSTDQICAKSKSLLYLQLVLWVHFRGAFI